MSTKITGQNLTRSFKINNPEDIKIACVVSEWHYEITKNLLTGAKDKLFSYGLLEKNIHEINVPGSFELIFGTKTLIKKDYDADFTIVDMNKIIEIKNEKIESKCGWSPFDGYKFKGTPTSTIVGGKIKMQDGKILGDPEGKPLAF